MTPQIHVDPSGEVAGQTGRGSLAFYPGILALILFLVSFTLFTRENQFKFYYHPDEKGKVEQVQTGKWNFNHPMLMLTTARWAAHCSGAVADPQRVVVAGRTVSAGFAAGSVVLLAAMAWLLAGRFAGIAAGLLLLTNHQLFELAHYFKEDTALLFGVSAWFLALALYWKRPGGMTAALLGAGAALAVSGKWVGVFALVLSLGLVPWRAGEKRTRALMAFLGALVAVFVLVNLPLLLHLATFEKSFQREVGLVVNGQGGMTRSVPHAAYWNVFRDNVTVWLWPFLAVHFAACWRKRCAVTAPEVLVLLFPVLLAIALSFSPKSNDRYFLPATGLFLCGVAFGMEGVRGRWPSRRMAMGLLGFVLLVQLVGRPEHDLRSYYRAFCVDDRADLAAWLNTNLPQAVLAQDGSVNFPVPENQRAWPFRIPLVPRLISKDIGKITDFAALRALGVTHVILSSNDYARFRMKSLRPQKGGEVAHAKSRVFYETLLAGTPLWKRPRGLVIYLHPGLEVYALPAE